MTMMILICWQLRLWMKEWKNFYVIRVDQSSWKLINVSVGRHKNIYMLNGILCVVSHIVKVLKLSSSHFFRVTVMEIVRYQLYCVLSKLFKVIQVKTSKFWSWIQRERQNVAVFWIGDIELNLIIAVREHLYFVQIVSCPRRNWRICDPYPAWTIWTRFTKEPIEDRLICKLD